MGLVLGAGGVVGQAYHAGVLAALGETTGWDPGTAEIVVGTSAGSITAAMLRLGVSSADLYARVVDRPLSAEGERLLGRVARPTRLPPRTSSAPRARRRPAAPALLARGTAVPGRMRPGVLAAAALPEGHLQVDGLFASIGTLYDSKRWPDDATWICAVNLDRGSRVVFGSEGAPDVDIETAVRASSAIPGFFAPVKVSGSRYVDGGAFSPTNLDLVADLGLGVVVVSSPMSAAGPRIPTSMRAVLRGPTGFVLGREVNVLRRHGTPVIAFQPTAADLRAMGINAMDFSRRGGVALQAYESARRYLAHPKVAERLRLLEA